MLNFLKLEMKQMMATDLADPTKPCLPICEVTFLNRNRHSRIIRHIKYLI